MSTLQKQPTRRKRHALSPIDAEHRRVRNLPSVKLLGKLFNFSTARAVLQAEAIGLFTGADR